MKLRMVGGAVGVAAALVLSAAAADPQGEDPLLGTLWAGRYTDAGTYSLEVAPDCSELVLQLIPHNGWEVSGYQVDVVSDPANFPLNRGGNPKIGQFQWRASFPPTATAQMISALPGQVIDPVSCGAVIEVAIHADMLLRDDSGVVVREEGAWGGPYGWGDQAWDPHGFLPEGFFDFPGAQWGFYLSVLWDWAPTPTPTATPTPIVPTPTPAGTSVPTPIVPTPTPVGTSVPTPIVPTPTPAGTSVPTPIVPTPTPAGTSVPTPVVPTPIPAWATVRTPTPGPRRPSGRRAH